MKARDFRDAGERYEAWPPPWRMEAAPDGRWRVRDARGQTVASGMPEWLAVQVTRMAPTRDLPQRFDP